MWKYRLMLVALTWTAAPWASAVVIGSDSASDAAYADGWQDGDNGGFGFDPWIFFSTYDPAEAARPEAHFMGQNAFVDIPSGGPAWGMGTDNQKFFNSTARVIRPFVLPMAPGFDISVEIDNPVFQPLHQNDATGHEVELQDAGGLFKLSLFAQNDTNGARWLIFDGTGSVDTGIDTSATATGGLLIEFALTGADTYDLDLTPLAGGTTQSFSGTLANPGTAVSRVMVQTYSNGSDLDGSREFYVNNLVQSATLLLGDANNSSTVTADDLISVQQNFGIAGPPSNGTLVGDANDDGVVTADDLISVQQNFGATLAPATAGAPVPEPATAALCATALVLTGAGRRPSADRRTAGWRGEA